MKMEELDSFLETFRQNVESCWSEETAYKVPDIQEYGPGVSGGQCVVTAMLLKQELEKISFHTNITLHLGSVTDLNNRVLIPNHGWLSVAVRQEKYIVDITIDQAPRVDCKIIFSKHPGESHGLIYKEKKDLTDREMVAQKDLFRRYRILKESYFTETYSNGLPSIAAKSRFF